MNSKVYYSKHLPGILPYLPKNLSGQTGLKVHFGEKGCQTFLNPQHAKDIYTELKKIQADISLVECNVLYKGSRTNADDHLKTAHEHGFDFAPIDICDGQNGDQSWEIPINKKHFSSIFVGKNLQHYKNLIVISHFKGHGGNGIGGALKNLGMGLGSRKGKMAMHAAFNLIVNKDKCIGCSTCANKCDASAISIIDQKANIDFNKCLRCAGCIANCPHGAIEIPWGSNSSQELQERITEYCYGIIQKINIPTYVNILENITPQCDCLGIKQKTIAPNLGFLISNDPIAIDQASLDLLNSTLKKNAIKDLHGIDPTYQLSYGEQLNLGTRQYELIKITQPVASK